MKIILCFICVMPIYSFGQGNRFLLGMDFAVPMGNFANLSGVGVGIDAAYSKRFTRLEVEYLNFVEKKIFAGPYWISSKLSMLNFKIGRKFMLYNISDEKALFVLPEIGVTTSYLIGDSNVGLSTKTNETDFAYDFGLGYKVRKFEIRYSIQFVRLSGSVNLSGNSPYYTIDYSSLKVGWYF